MHWADFTAEKLSKNVAINKLPARITPSGEFHIGHIREILSAEMIHRACLDAGLDSRYISSSTQWSLRRVYPFLSEEYRQYIGCPLAFIPAPNSDGNPDPKGVCTLNTSCNHS